MNLLPEVEEVFDKFSENGFEINLVGGCIRDYLIGKEIHDIDMCTNAKPQEVIKLFNKVIPLGIKYGTVHVIVDDKEFEITTYREDGIYKDGRKPEYVKFIPNLKDDLKRRDFTINAMAYNRKDGLIDIFGGKKDIENKVVRAVGDASTRFNEDAIRMLRAIKFASKLNFDIENATLNAIISNKELIKKVSNDRVRNELNGIIVSKNVKKGFSYLIDTGLFEMLFEKSYETYAKQENIIIQRINNLDSVELSSEERLKVVIAVILFKNGNIEYSLEIANRFLKKYNYPNSISKDVLNIIKYMEIIPYNINEVNEKLLKKIISKTSGLYPLFLKAIKAIFYNENVDVVNNIIKKLQDIMSNDIICKRSELAINGNDLLELGFPQGKAISIALDDLVNLVIDKPALNTKESLIYYIKKRGIESYVKSDSYARLKNNAIQRLKSEIMLNNKLTGELDSFDVSESDLSDNKK